MSKARKRSVPLITALEPRMLLDGAALTEATQALTDVELQSKALAEPAPQTPQTTDADTTLLPDTATVQEPVFALSNDPVGQIVVVDASVPFADQLLADIPPEWTVIRLNADSDGLTQLTQALQGQNNIKAIHLFSHGSDGQLQLGSLTLTGDNMVSRQADLELLGSHLTDTGDLMLYGCDIALDFVGQSFVSRLAALTHADVAASNDATGNVVTGGDWELEYNTGQIDTATIEAVNYSDTLGTINMTKGLAAGASSINIGRYAPRLYWQASGPVGYDPNTTDAKWVDQYTSDQHVSYWSSAWASFTYTVPRWGWLPWETRTAWYQYPVVADWNYGSGTRYGVETVTLAENSAYRFDVNANTLYKDLNGNIQTASGFVNLNTALYKGSFDPTDPLKNLVTASQGGGWDGLAGGKLQQSTLQAGTYQVVVSFDTNRWIIGVDNNVWWSGGNNYAQQLWGDFTLNVTNLNRAPVWTARDLSQSLTGSGTQAFSIPWSLSDNQTLTDPDGDAMTVTAKLANGSALPSWLTFNPNNLSFTGNPPANTGMLTLRLTATDGQLSSTRDFTVTYSNDNDQPVVAALIPDQTWNGAGSFSYQIPENTFSDSDPGAGSFTYTATRSDGSALPSWLSFNAATRTLSGNPPANFASFDIKITANDGTGQANATQSDTFTLNLTNNNDIPTVSNISKTINEDSSYSFSAADFVLNDSDTRATNDTTVGSGKTLQSIRIVKLPANGTLWMDANGNGTLDAGEVLQVNQTVTAANLGNLRYTPNKDWAGAVGLDLSNAPDSFQWTATDGVNEAINPATTSITVNLINDAPVLGFTDGRTLSVRPNTGGTLAAITVDAGLTLSDVDAAFTSNTAYDSISKVTISLYDKVTSNFVTGDTLSVTAATATANGITASYNSSTGVLTLTGAARAAAYQTVLRTLQFSSSNTSNDNLREISMQLQAADVGTMTFASFDGVNNSIDTLAGSLPVGGDFTVSVWAQIDAAVADGSYTILAQGNTVDNFFIMLSKSGGNNNLRLGDNWTISNGFPTDGKWHQYTVTRNGTAGTLFIDGIKVGTGTMEASLPGTSLRIGGLYRRDDVQEWSGAYWKGGISDVRIYNRVIDNTEITASLNRDAALKGYEPNLVAWYPLLGDLLNHATTFSWSLGRDFNPLNGDGTDGPWSLGIIGGDTAATGNFNWSAFQALTSSNIKVTTSTDPQGGADYIMLENTDAQYSSGNGWGRFQFTTGFDGNVGMFTPGAVTVLPGYVNPAAMQFTAPVAGIYAVDARLWDGNIGFAGGTQFKVFKVNAAGTSAIELQGATTVAEASLPNTAASWSNVRQVVLAAGERLVFAVHKGDAGNVNGDEVRAAIDLNLLAVQTASGYYYSLEDGHYYGLSANTAPDFDAARATAQSVSLGGQVGYLATPSTPTAIRIGMALAQQAYDLAPSNARSDYLWTGVKQLNKLSEPGGGWFWTDGPEANTPFFGLWNSGEPNNANGTEDYGSLKRTGGFNDLPFSYANTRALIEFGNAPMAAPSELSAALGSYVDPGNALVFVDSSTAYSTRTGHYYKLSSTAGDFATMNTAGGSYAGQSGYLVQATTPQELAIVTRLARVNNSSGVWVGLKNVDTNGQGLMDWKWVNTNGTVSSSLDSSLYYQTAESTNTYEAAGWTRVAYDSFDHGTSGWVLDSNGAVLGITNGELGRFNEGWVVKAFDVNNVQTKITFKFNRYDTWDGENLYIRLRWGDGNNYLDIAQSFISGTEVTRTITGTATLNGKSVNYTITPVKNFGNFAYSSWDDQSFNFEIDLPTNFAETLRFYLNAMGLNQGVNDESYTIDNFTIWQKNVPSNPGLGGTYEDFENDVLTGWDYGFNSTSLFYNPVTVNRGDGDTKALWFGGTQPQKTYYIGNEATRVEFDFYALDSWDYEYFYTYINDSWFAFQRVFNYNYTNVVTGSTVVDGKPVTWSITPNNDYRNWSKSPGGWADQSFHFVIDLPENFGESFKLKFNTNLDTPGNDESAAVDNVRVYSRENAGWLDPNTGVLQSSPTNLNTASTSGNIVRLEQFASINLWNNRWYTDGDWNSFALATDGKRLYSYTYSNDGGTIVNSIQVFDMNGRVLGNLWPNVTIGNSAQMTYSSGWLYARNSNVTSTASDDTLYRISTLDGSSIAVTLDASHPLLAGQAWAYGSLFNMPDGRLGIVSTSDASGNATVRMYTLADNGSRLVWSQDYAINMGAGWLGDSHGATSDGRYLYLLRFVNGSDQEYKVIDLTTGQVALDGTAFNLSQQGVDNATSMAMDPLTGDIYFADHNGSHIARAVRTNGAMRQAVYEYGTSTLASPLLTTQGNVAKPDIFVSDTRQIVVRVGNTAPSVSSWSASLTEDGRLAFNANDFNSRFTDPESDSLATITLSSVPANGALKLGNATLINGSMVAAGDLDKLVFIPNANFNGTTSFSYTASDGYLSSGASTVTLTVSAVNDAPVLDTSASPVFNAIAEDVLDASNTGTLVSALVVTGSITDVDLALAPKAIAVTGVDNTLGVWQYRIGAGAWTAFSATTAKNVDLGSAARLLDASDSIRFVPNANVNSAANGSPSISFRAWDKTAGVAGGTLDPNQLGGNTAVSSASDTASLSITAVNDAPTTASKTVTMDEDTAYTFSASDFSFIDIDGDSLASVTLQLPSVGQLLLNNVVQTSAITVTAANLGTVKFRPVADAYGAPYASLAFTVSDGAASSASATLTFNVTDTNDAPTNIAWNTGGTVPENSAEGTLVGKLAATDPNLGDTFTFQRVSNPNFTITPDGSVKVAANATLDYESATSQTVRVRVTDSGGLSYEKDITVNLSDVLEAAPSLIVNSLYVSKNETVTITTSQLKASDSVQTDSQLTYTVSSAPSGGTWWIDANNNNVLDNGEIALAPVNKDANPNGVDTFTQADVVAGRLKFTQDGSQSNSVLQLSLSDGTPASTDANGHPLVNGSLVAIVSSPPVVNPVSDQQWKTSGAQSFALPSSTFTDPDFDLVTVTATLADGTALPAWLSFDASTWTFSGTPVGYADGQSIDIQIGGTDGRHAAVTDVFRITFNDVVTAPSLVTPIASQVFDGAGTKSFTVDAGTFSAQTGYAITGYTATRADGTALPAWLSFNAGTRTFSGNPPADAVPGPYWLKVTANTASGGNTSATFKLTVLNANDIPVEASPVDTAIPNVTIADANEHTWVIPTGAFTDGDGDTLTLRAGDVNGNALPSWVRFDPATRTFSAKAPAGSGTLVVRLFAEDGKGGTGYADFTLTYSGGVNLAPLVMTSAGIYSMDGRGDLNLNPSQKAELFSVAQGQTATLSNNQLKELDPDDDGIGLTYTVTTATRYGQLWLDTDGDGTLNGAEVALNIGGSFTQADIDAGKLKYRNTDTVTVAGNDPPDDKFIFNLADGGENGVLAVKGAVFDIQVTPKPTAPTLLSVLRSGPSSELTNADSLTFKLIFSESVRNVDASDFELTGDLAAQGQITGISMVNGMTYLVTVGSKEGTAGIANANGTLGLKLASAPTIKNSTQTADISTAPLTATVNDETYTLDNTAPSATLAATVNWHDGTTAFYVTLDFGSDAINDLALNDLSASNATLSELQRISTDGSVDPNAPPVDYNELTSATQNPTGNLYRVKVTPSNNSAITVTLTAAGVTDAAGNGNARQSVTIDRNSLPTVRLDPASLAINNTATFTERDGADNGSQAVAFTTNGTALADANSDQNLAWLKIAVANAGITDGAAETLRINGTAIALNFADGTAIADIILNSVTYSVTASNDGAVRSLIFAKSGGGTLTLTEAEALLDALTYNNSSDTPHTGNRVFAVTLNDGIETSSTATFTVTVVATNDTPVITITTGDSATATRAETNSALLASGTLSVQDRDLGGTVAASVYSVVASGTTTGLTSNNAALRAMLSVDGSNVIGSTTTTGTIHWAFNSGSQAFDYLAVGETLTLTYTVRATDSAGSPAHADQTVVVTITGTNDAPKITASTVSSVDNSSTTVASSGAISFTDPDASDAPSAVFVKTTGTQYTATRSGGGNFTLNAAAISALQDALTITTPASGNWIYSLDTMLLQDDLDALVSIGDKILVTYSVAVTDSHGGSKTQDLKFTLIGSGSGGTLVASGDAGSIVEGSPATLSDAGSLTVDSYPAITSATINSTVHYTYAGLSLTTTTTPSKANFETAIKNGLVIALDTTPDNDVINWTYALAEADLDFLPNGVSVEAQFTIDVSDGSNTTQTTVTIIIRGTNDAPIITSSASAAEGSVTEIGAGVPGTAIATGTLTASDVDFGATKTWSGNATGTYGSLSIDASTGVWTYTLDNTDADTQALTAGQTAVETFTTTVSDSVGGSVTQVVRITINGSNDAPVLNAPGNIATYTDTPAYDTFSTVTGSLTATDIDTGDTRSYAITGQSVDTSQSGYTHSLTGSYGKLYLNALTGAYKYVPNAAKMNAATDTVSDSFILTATDASGATSNTAALSVTINGVNDTPTLSTRARSTSVVADLYETNSALSTSGTLVAGEVDTSQTLNIDISLATVQLNGATPSTMNSTQLGWLTLPSTTSSGTTSVAWTFNSGSEAFNDLRAGDTLTLAYTVRVSDGTLSATLPINVVIHGTNDAPVISIDTIGTADSTSAALTEDSASPLTASGTLSVADAEAGDSLTASVTGVTVHSSSTAVSGAIPANAVLLAMMGVSPNDTNGLLSDNVATSAVHGLTWTFNSGSETFNALAAGETLVLDYTLRVVDNASGSPGMAMQTVRVTLTGTNDAPTMAYAAITSGKSATGSDDGIADAIQGFIASGFADKLFDSGALTFTDLDTSDQPTASVTATQITGALRNGAAGTLSLSATQQTAIANAFSLSPSATNANNGQINWAYTINQANIDFLGSGQSVTAVFTVTINDANGGTASQNVTIIISGKNNAPVIGIEAGDNNAQTLTESNAGLSYTDTLTVTDTNLTDAVTAQVLSATAQRNNGTVTTMASGDARLGWLTLSPTTVLSGSSRTVPAGSLTWIFNSGSESFNDLAAGETLVLSYTIRVTDDAPTAASGDQTITLTITGTNDAPVITAGPDTDNLLETHAGLSSNGNLTVTDLDTHNVVSVSRTLSVSGTSNRSDTAAPTDAQLLAMLQLSSDNSTWQSAPFSLVDNAHTTAPLYWRFNSGNEAFNYLATGETLVLTYTVTATDNDGTPLAATETVTITITGTNDAPTITGGPATAELTETDNNLRTSGNLTVTDLDTSNAVVANRTLAVTGNSNRSDPAAPTDAALLAMFSVSPTSILNSTQTSATLTWSFDSGQQAFDYLAQGQTLILTYTVTATDDDGNPLAATETVTITITGSNDLPTISLGRADSASATLSETNAALNANGTLTVSDVDRANTVAPSVVAVTASGTTSGLPANNAALLAMLTVDSGNVVSNIATTGTLSWFFTSGDEPFNYLAEGEQLVLTYTVRATDSSSGTVDFAVVITITGSNDAPTMSVTAPSDFVEATDASAQVLTSSGSVNFVDLDASDLIDVSYQTARPAVWSGGPLSAALAQSLANGFTVAATHVSVTTPVSWSYSHAATDFDFLGAGESITFSYTVFVSDSQGQQVTAPVQFTIIGSNDAPTLNAVTAIGLTDTAGNDRFLSIVGALASTDRDTNDSATYGLTGGSADSSRTGYDRKLAGSFGTLYLNSSTGAYEYQPDATVINALTTNASESFTLSVTDGSNATVSQVLAVSIMAANDTPELSASRTSATFVDTPLRDRFNPVNGILSGTDRDTGATLSYAIQGGAADTSLGGYTLSKAGHFGTLYLNSSTGAYTFVPDAAAIEGQAGGTREQSDFVFEVSDGTLSQTTGLTIWVVGAGDPPVLSDGNDTVALTEDNSTLTASGSLTVTDSDLSDAVNLSTTLTTGGTTTATLPSHATLLGMLSLSPTHVLDDASTTTATVSWAFNSGAEHFDFLAAGETLVLTYTISATDTGSPALSDSTTVTLSITGTNDGPALVAPITVALLDTAENDTLLNATGTLAGSDADHNAVLTYSLAGQTTGSYSIGGENYNVSKHGQFGTLYLNSSNGAWVYVPQNAAVQALKQDDNDTFSVRVSDGTDSATQSLNVAITATNDTPLLGAITAMTYTDTAVDDSFSAISGRLSSVDRDGDAVSYSVTGQVSEVNLINSVRYDSKKIGTFGTLYLNGSSGAYVFVPDDAALEGVKTSVSEYFGMVASDGTAMDGGLLTIRVAGSNDTPTLSASVTTITLTDTANNDRFAAVTGVLSSTDRDIRDSATYSATGDSADSSRTGYDRKWVGTYGTLYLNSGTGAYEYQPDATTINALNANTSESFTLKVSDGSNATASQVVVVNLVGTNDIPELSASLPSTTFVDTSVTDTFNAVTGTLIGTDRDRSAALSYLIQGGAADVTLSGYTVSLAGNYGTLYLNSTTGAYTYVPDIAAINAMSANARDDFNMVVSDGIATQSTGFTAWIVGASDKPVISEGLDTLNLTEADATLSGSGSITVTDNDLTDAVNLSMSVAVDGTTSATLPSNATLLAMLTLNPITVLNDTSSITTGVNWVFNSGSEHFDTLATGETLVLTYTVSATDTGSPALNDTTTITITITGTNDGPVLVAPATVVLTDTALNDTLANVTGTLTGTDADHNAVLNYSVVGQSSGSYTIGVDSYDVSKAGLYGRLYLNSSTGAYVYVPDDAAIEALKTNASEAFSVRVSDGMANATQNLNVTIVGVNDTPTLSASVTAVSYTDTASNDRFQSVAGSLTSSDRDANDSASYGITGAATNSSRTGFDLSKTGNYGTLFVHSQTGAYLYVPNDAAINAQTTTVTENFALSVTDGSGASTSQMFTVNIHGINDVPTVTNTAAATQGSVTEAGHLDDGTVVAGNPSTTGTLSVADVDASASRTWALQGSPTTTYGTITLDASTGVWTYTLDNSLAATQALQEGETVTQTYVARATDDFGAHVDQTLTVTIHGANDVPVISNAPSDAQGTVIEAGHLDNGTVVAGNPSTTGTLSVADVDASASRTWALQGSPTTTYGTITLDASTGVWTYTLDNSLAATQALQEGETVTQTYVARATDDFGAHVDQTLMVTIHGANDVPVISNAPSDAQGTVIEAGNADDGSVLGGTPLVSGRIQALDVDRGAVLVYELEGHISTRYGTISLDKDTGNWRYVLDNSLPTTQNLREGQTVVERYTVRVTDNLGAVAHETIEVTLVGSNDVPTVVDTLAAKAYLQGEHLEMPTAQLFSDIDLDSGELTFTITAQLPPGLQINATTGIISGAGTQPGDYVIVIRATDAQGAWAQTTWSVRINAPARDSSGSTAGNKAKPSDQTGGEFAPTGSGSGNNNGNALYSDVLGGGIPGFASTIPVPTLSGNTPLVGDPGANGVNNAQTLPALPASALNSAPAAETGRSGQDGSTASGEKAASSGTPAPVPQTAEKTDTRVEADGQVQQNKAAETANNPNKQDDNRSASERIDVSVGANGQVSLRQQAPKGDESPTGIMVVEVVQQQAGLQMEIADFRRNQVSEYRATLPDGKPLPAWINVDPRTGTLTATPDKNVQLIELKFTAQDANGTLRTIDIKLDLSNKDTSAAPLTAPVQAIENRPAFMTQLAVQKQQWEGYGEQILSSFTEQ